uniref:S24/S26 family peptidase n=1 Tax=Acetatifactor sp. TaxID=1872090 RepID=UPI0040560DFE
MKEKISIEELLAQGKTVQFTPIGSSMCPLFAPQRDQAIVAPVEDRRLKRGDVVLYRRKQSVLVLHRIWKVKSDGFYMVGDNQREIEGPIEREQIKGIMVAMIRKGKQFSVQNPGYRLGTMVWLQLRPFRHVISGPVMNLIHMLRK